MWKFPCLKELSESEKEMLEPSDWHLQQTIITNEMVMRMMDLIWISIIFNQTDLIWRNIEIHVYKMNKTSFIPFGIDNKINRFWDGSYQYGIVLLTIDVYLTNWMMKDETWAIYRALYSSRYEDRLIRIGFFQSRQYIVQYYIHSGFEFAWIKSSVSSGW